jgi:hypothetical protein
MSQMAASPTSFRGRSQPGVSGVRLRGPALLLARAAYAILAALTLVMFIASLPWYFALGEAVCHSDCATNQLSPVGVQRLHATGLSLEFYAWYAAVVACLFALVYLAVSLLIMWRRSDEPAALAAAVGFLGFPLLFTDVTKALPTSWSWPVLPLDILGILGGGAMFLFMVLFPDGHFAPGWTRWPWLVGLGLYTASGLSTSVLLKQFVGQYIVSAMVAGMIAAQVYRYLRVSSPAQRQQTKWVVLGFLVSALSYPFTVAPHRNLPSFYAEGSLPAVIGFGATYLLFMLMPISFAIAMLRSHLWDIDHLIQRTLVYGALTAILGALYFALVVGLQDAIQAWTRQTQPSSVLVVLTTLLIAALSTPMRRWLQAAIDQRFNRRNYDATRTLEEFGATLRTGTDLDALRIRLLGVAQQTMQPEHITLWLAPHHQRRFLGRKALASSHANQARAGEGS